MKDKKLIVFSKLFPLIEEKIDAGGNFTFTAFGNSMHPYLKNGKHRVTLSPIKDELRHGDVVFYRRKDGAFVLHRVVKIKNGIVYFCGDNQFYLEPHTNTVQSIALLTGIEYNGKHRDPFGLGTRLWCATLPFRRFFLRALNFIKHRIVTSNSNR